MAGLKDIKRRLKSVRNTKKITYAMKLVSAAKLKKAQVAVTEARAYTEALSALMVELASEQDASDFRHPLMAKRKAVKKIHFLVIGGTRGLCGGYNTNVQKRVEVAYTEALERHPQAQIDATIIGKKVGEYFRRTKRSYTKAYEDLPESANDWPIDEICLDLECAFLKGEVDEVRVIYTRFKSAMSMKVLCERLLPLSAEMLADSDTSEQRLEGGASELSGIALFEPSATEVFEAVVPRILRTRVRQAGLDTKASEHGSRMVAMESATTNAGELLQELTLKHNKMRQSAITSELLDIIGGAEALT
ncbi:ATP synthase F1 subunit gamma [Oligoflexia bacterium]|nr:ATP synthase F1 subunit gamma [Oligoflexia bacterium]